MRLLVAALAAAAFIASFDSASALAPSLDIVDVQCAPTAEPGQPTHPPGGFDLIKIRNVGDAPQDLAGWELRSDPEDVEKMQLAVAGVLDPGEQDLWIVAGPHSVTLPSYNMYQWSPIGVLREGEPMDYVKLIDPNGNMVEGVYCDGQAIATPTPTAPPVNATPTPAPPAVSANTGNSSDSTSNDTQNNSQVSGSTGQTSQQQVAGNVLAQAPDTGIGSLAPTRTVPGFFALVALALGATGLLAGGVLVRGAAPALFRRQIRIEVEEEPGDARGTIGPSERHSRG